MEEVIWFVIDMFRFLTGGILIFLSSVMFVIMIFGRESITIRVVILAVCAMAWCFGYWVMPEGYDV